MSTIELKKKIKLISMIGVGLHKYGTNAQRLEASLKFISNYLGLKGHFFTTPTYLAISIDSDDEQFSRHMRVTPAGADLEKLQELDSIANAICLGGLSIDEAIKQIQELEDRPSSYGHGVLFLAYGLTSTALCAILKGGTNELILSFILGSIVGILAIFKIRSPKISDIFEFLSAFTVMICCYLAYHFQFQFSFQIVLISSLIVIVPGLGLTIAMTELATQHLVSGTARLMGAMIDFFKISFGILLGVEVGKLLLGNLPMIEATPLGNYYIIPATILAALSFTVIFNAKKKDFIWVLLSGIVTIGALNLCLTFFNQTLSVFISAFIIGLFSNLFARIRQRPAAITLLPGIIFLVPGSVGLKGLNLIFQEDFIAGLSGGFQMLIVAISIVAGLFLANVALNPRKNL
ncbi:MAG: uncharacterized membrane protein YjjP (DUF1212 family) [Bacteriovoracaceae bacterium]|jgi:uncharacterized membrane protein YjjP (DUF1212 family)